MNSPHSLPRFKPANDLHRLRPPPQISIVMRRQQGSSAGLLLGVSVCAITLGYLGFIGWLATREPLPATPAEIVVPVTVAVMPLPLGSPEAPEKTEAAVPVPSATPEIAQDNSANLLPFTPIPDDALAIAAIADKIAALPALKQEKTKPDLSIAAPPKDEEDAYALLTRAYHWQESGEFGQAQIAYNQVLARDPQNHDALAGEAYLLAHDNKVSSAIAINRRLLALNPHDAAAAANLGQLLQQQGNMDEAILWLNQAARESSGNLQYRLNLATLYDRTHHAAEAMMLYRQILDVAGTRRVRDLPLDHIRERLAYLEASSSGGGDPSTTLSADH